ncbi:MAG: deoxyribodipyrimidine photo-lyase [Dehalococcoidia bacterium]
MTTRSIHWFREDLRLSDNPSLFEACKSGHVIPIYIHDNCSTPELGKVSRWWLHHSLAKLDKSLDGKLRIFTGDTTDILMQVITQYGVHKVFWNKVYSPEQFDLDVQVISLLSEKNILI